MLSDNRDTSMAHPQSRLLSSGKGQELAHILHFWTSDNFDNLEIHFQILFQNHLTGPLQGLKIQKGT